MKTLRLVLCIAIVTAAGLAVLPRASAKGPADKVTITGPGLDEMIEITDPDIAGALSMGAIEDFPRAIDMPDRLGAGYELTRYFRLENGSYQPFDQIAYYPDLYGGSGYVNYLGIVNGRSEYDGKWFRAQEAADAVMRQVLFEHGVLLQANLVPVEPYLAVTSGDGTLRLVDATTLEDAASLRLEEAGLSLEAVIGSLDGQRLYVSTSRGAGITQQRVVNLGSARRNCFVTPASRALTLTSSGNGLVVENGEALEIRGAESLELLATIPLDRPLPETAPASRAYFPSPDRRWLYVLAYDAEQAAIYPLDLNTREFAPAVRLDAPPPDPVFAGQWDADGRRFHLLDGERIYTIDSRRRLITIERLYITQDDRAVKLADLGGPLAFAGARQDTLYLYHPAGPDGGVFAVDIRSGAQRQLWEPDRVFSRVIYADGRFYAVQVGSNTLVALDASSGDALASRALEPGERLEAVVWLAPQVVESAATLDLACAPGL